MNSLDRLNQRDRLTLGLKELRSHKIKRQLARIGASILVGLVAFALTALALSAHFTAREWLVQGVIFALIAWGGWGIHFLTTRHK